MPILLTYLYSYFSFLIPDPVFFRGSRKSLRSYKAKLQVIHDKFSQLEIDILFELYRESSKRIPCPPFMRILIGRMLDSDYIEYHEEQGTVFINGIKASHDFLSITKEGIEFVNEIKKREM